jgi:hypothetical protein
MKRLTESQFLDLFDLEVHDKIRAAAARYHDAEALVCFENVDFTSSHFGHRAALVVGPSNTYTLADVMEPGAHLGEVPSVFQYPVAYVDYRKPLSETPDNETSTVS